MKTENTETAAAAAVTAENAPVSAPVANADTDHAGERPAGTAETAAREKTDGYSAREQDGYSARGRDGYSAREPSVNAADGYPGGISPDGEEARAVVDEWRRDAALLGEMYPGFDLRREMRDGRFRRYLLVGDSVRTAYENVHRAEIMAAGERNAEARAAARFAGMIAAGARFPSENALSSSATGRTKSGVSHFSKSDRADIIRRAASGERIVF